jgi:thiol-disulfide isomerase/thioredoxin
MKSIALIVLIINLVSCFEPAPLKTGLEGTALPAFSLLLMDSTTRFNSSSLPADKPIVLFYFSPDCPYCRAQTESIISNIESLKDIQFCMLTYWDFGEIKDYYKKYKLNKYSNIVVGQDYSGFFGEHFKTQSVPYIAIYDKNKILTQVLIGNVGAKAIRHASHG